MNQHTKPLGISQQADELEEHMMHELERVVTPIAVFTKREGCLALASWHPDASLDEVRDRTGFAFEADGARPTPLPTQAEADALAALDPRAQFQHDAAIRLR